MDYPSREARNGLCRSNRVRGSPGSKICASLDLRAFSECLRQAVPRLAILLLAAVCRHCSCDEARGKLKLFLLERRIGQIFPYLSALETGKLLDSDLHSHRYHPVGIGETTWLNQRWRLSADRFEASGERAQALAPRWSRIS